MTNSSTAIVEDVFPATDTRAASFGGTLVKLGMLGLLKADAVLDAFKEADKRADRKDSFS